MGHGIPRGDPLALWDPLALGDPRPWDPWALGDPLALLDPWALGTLGPLGPLGPWGPGPWARILARHYEKTNEKVEDEDELGLN